MDNIPFNVLSQCPEGEKWTIEAGTEDFYLVFRTKDQLHMGWMLLNADPDSGEIKMIDYLLTTEHSISLP